MVSPSPSSVSQQRSPMGQQIHSSTSISSQHLNPHSSNPTFASYASSISSPGSRPASPSIVGATTTVPTPPQSPTAYQLKTFSAPPTPPISTIVAVGTPGTPGLPSSSQNSYFPNQYAPPPPPTPTFFSLISQPVTRTVLVLTVIMTLVSLGGKFPDHCTSPSKVLYADQYPALLASPFIVPLTPALLASAKTGLVSSVILAFSNLLSLALFEDHLTVIFNGDGPRIFRNMVFLMMGLIMGLRQFLGFVFSRATGWHIPALFFSDSMFECNLGLAPFLFALLVVQALFPHSSPSIYAVGDKPSSLWTIRRTHIQIVLCLLNVVPKTIVWWAGSGLIVGFFAAMTISFQRRMGHWGGKVKTSAYEKQLWESEVFEAMLEEDEAFSDSPSTDFLPYTKEKRHGLKALAYVLPTIFFVLLFLVGCNQFHTIRPNVSSMTLNDSIEPQTPYLLTLVLMTAPRKNGVNYIRETLDSYLRNFPDENVDPLYNRIQIVVYTHFTDYPGYDEAMLYYSTIAKARKHVKWVRDPGSEKNQRKHLVSAIRTVGAAEDSVYLGIMEDDFPFCEGGWQEMLNTIYAAHETVPDHCGVFVGTGGSGLIFKRSVALTASFLLEQDALMYKPGKPTPPDVSLQNCLLGEHEYCSSCAGTLVTSRTLLQRHLGHNTSSSSEFGYDPNDFQCGWRHPFNGMPTVHTI
ncbi:hypothetical protein BGZ52_005394 [Haplosporangium bisporale]|uniref:Uncharacterized protein n=1 Tax=Podila verticillata NRRL 6337 TaxID=1069443 RepID=A0A086TKZ4_9FUNG|nr:hypothetical protein BGZ52_005394 [Haplosporangium bisporale]KAF9205636.1 hypothetical protein BGZ59_000371 [Podila verticillata]KFH62621.1 hypothetical protein MVEG_12013 [Podila verticillata NRRL 6337]